jgi:hypothetical protein
MKAPLASVWDVVRSLASQPPAFRKGSSFKFCALVNEIKAHWDGMAS